MSSDDLLFSDLRAANIARLPTFRNKKSVLLHPPKEGEVPGHNWLLSQWGNALAGEVGEVAGLLKSIEKGDCTLEEAREDLGRELADVQTYLDLLAHRAGISLSQATLQKWNEVSERVGSPVRLAPYEAHLEGAQEHVDVMRPVFPWNEG